LLPCSSMQTVRAPASSFKSRRNAILDMFRIAFFKSFYEKLDF
jgi:hypothetical protein